MNNSVKRDKRCLTVSMTTAIIAGIETAICTFITFLSMLFQTDPRRDKFCLVVLGIALVVAILEALIFKNEQETEYNYMILNSIVKLILNITIAIEWHWFFLPAQIVIMGISVFAMVFIIKSWWNYMTEE